PRMLLAEEDRAPHCAVHERRAEGAWKAPPLGGDEIHAALAVDLRAAEEEDVDAPLAGKVEELARALGERIGLAALQERDPQARLLLAQKEGAGGGNRRGGAHGDVPRLGDQPRDHAGEELLLAVVHGGAQPRTNCSRYCRKPSRVFAARA